MEPSARHFTAIELIRYISHNHVETDPEKVQDQLNEFVHLCQDWIRQHDSEVKADIGARELGIIRQRSEALVIALCGAKIAPDWWKSRNRAFDMETPEHVWSSDPTRVYKYLMSQSDYFI